MNLFYTIMMLMGCVQRYYPRAEYGTWNFNPALDQIFREYRRNLDRIEFKLEWHTQSMNTYYKQKYILCILIRIVIFSRCIGF